MKMHKCTDCAFHKKGKLKFDKRTGKPFYKEKEFGEIHVCFKFSANGDKIPEGTENTENECTEFFAENENRVQA